MRLNFDMDRNGFWDRIVVVKWRRGKDRKNHLTGIIDNAGGDQVGRADVAFKNSPRRLSIWIDDRDVAFSPGFYEMNVVTRDWGTSCAQDPCRDWLPDSGTIVHHVWPDCFGLDPDRIGTMQGEFMRSSPRHVVFSRGGDDRVEPGRHGSGYVCSGPGEDVVIGDSGPDKFSGETGADRLRGRGAHGCDQAGVCGIKTNVLQGGPGADWLIGGPGFDVASGGDGDDHLEGRDSNDHLVGGKGRDDIDGGDGRDECHGGEILHAC